MQAKVLLKKFLIMLPTSLFLFNLAFAQADYTDPYQEQSEQAASDGNDTADDNNNGSDGAQAQDDANNVPSGNSDYNDSYNEDDYN